jgi:hypothetical protein
MSHGHGRVQRALLEAFRQRDVADTFWLAGVAFNVQPNADGVRLISDAELVATRRALTKLVAQGLVFELDRPKNGRRRWCSQRHGLYQALLIKKIQIGNSDYKFGITERPYTADEIAEFRRQKGELIIHAKALGAWPYIRARLSGARYRTREMG